MDGTRRNVSWTRWLLLSGLLAARPAAALEARGSQEAFEAQVRLTQSTALARPATDIAPREGVVILGGGGSGPSQDLSEFMGPPCEQKVGVTKDQFRHFMNVHQAEPAWSCLQARFPGLISIHQQDENAFSEIIVVEGMFSKNLADIIEGERFFKVFQGDRELGDELVVFKVENDRSQFIGGCDRPEIVISKSKDSPEEQMEQQLVHKLRKEPVWSCLKENFPGLRSIRLPGPLEPFTHHPIVIVEGSFSDAEAAKITGVDFFKHDHSSSDDLDVDAIFQAKNTLP